MHSEPYSFAVGTLVYLVVLLVTGVLFGEFVTVVLLWCFLKCVERYCVVCAVLTLKLKTVPLV